MALHLNTNEGNNGEENIDSWLQKHRLTKIKPIFEENEVIMDDLIGLADTCNIDSIKLYNLSQLPSLAYILLYVLFTEVFCLYYIICPIMLKIKL